MLKEYYENVIAKPSECFPKWEELDGVYLLGLENTTGFAGYKIGKAMEKLKRDFSGIITSYKIYSGKKIISQLTNDEYMELRQYE